MYKRYYKSGVIIGLLSVIPAFYAMGMEEKVSEDKRVIVTMYTSNQSNIPLYVDYNNYFDEKGAEWLKHCLGRYRAFEKPGYEDCSYTSAISDRNEGRLFSCVADEKGISVRFAWAAPRDKTTDRPYSRMQKFDFPWEDIKNHKKREHSELLCGPSQERALFECSVAKDSEESVAMPHVYVSMKFYIFQ